MNHRELIRRYQKSYPTDLSFEKWLDLLDENARIYDLRIPVTGPTDLVEVKCLIKVTPEMKSAIERGCPATIGWHPVRRADKP